MRKKKQKRPPKKVCQELHAKKRFRQRFGMEITKEEYEEAIKLIQDGKATFVERQSNRVTAFLLEIRFVKVIVVYDSTRKTITSFLPPSYLLEHEQDEPPTEGVTNDDVG